MSGYILYLLLAVLGIVFWRAWAARSFDQLIEADEHLHHPVLAIKQTHPRKKAAPVAKAAKEAIDVPPWRSQEDGTRKAAVTLPLGRRYVFRVSSHCRPGVVVMSSWCRHYVVRMSSFSDARNTLTH